MATNPQNSAPEGYFDQLEGCGFSPGWAKREPQMWAEPRRRFVPTVWRYREALDALTKATEFVSTEFAERRNLILVNPIENNIYPTCRHLVAAYQLVLPGETARSHRHSPNALRLVLDATEGVYTLVDGIRVDMAPGDVVLPFNRYVETPVTMHVGAGFIESVEGGLHRTRISGLDSCGPKFQHNGARALGHRDRRKGYR